MAIEYFRHAIQEDPLYALAYAGLSDSYYRLSNLYLPTTEAMPKAKLAAQRALEIDETLAEAHAALGLVLMFYDWDWAGAKRECSRAIELNPGCAIAHQRGNVLRLGKRSRLPVARKSLRRKIGDDPVALRCT
jgi:tetratricopeptide (TPR) repeat protein